jgi:hypothetical protein
LVVEKGKPPREGSRKTPAAVNHELLFDEGVGNVSKARAASRFAMACGSTARQTPRCWTRSRRRNSPKCRRSLTEIVRPARRSWEAQRRRP